MAAVKEGSGGMDAECDLPDSGDDLPGAPMSKTAPDDGLMAEMRVHPGLELAVDGGSGRHEGPHGGGMLDGMLGWGQRACPAVMVVDDSPLVTNALSRVLDAKGYRAVPFMNSADALAWLEVNHKTDPPAVVLVDVHLPDGSGIDVARRARQLLGDEVPVVAVSGDTSIEMLKVLPESGVTLFVAKPIHVATLLSKLRVWASGVGTTV